MDSFAFIIHPIDPKRDVARKYPLLGRILSEPMIDFVCRFWPPVKLSHVTGIRSEATGKEVEGWLLAVPYTPQRMLSLRPQEVYRKVIATGHLAERLGANILGLGAYTSVVGDGGVTIAQALDIAVTSGDSYTAAISVKAVLDAAQRMGVDLMTSTLAVVGSSGAIGRTVSQLLAPHAGHLLLIGRRLQRLEAVAKKVRDADCVDVRVSLRVEDIREAEVVVTVTSSGGNLVRPNMLRRGAIVCDVSRPRDVSQAVTEARSDVLVVDGGLVRVPGAVDFGFDYGLPPDLTYGCFAETITLAFEGRFEDYSIGRDMSLERVKEIDALASKHGFELAALRSFERKLDEALIQDVKAKARPVTPVG